MYYSPNSLREGISGILGITKEILGVQTMAHRSGLRFRGIKYMLDLLCQLCFDLIRSWATQHLLEVRLLLISRSLGTLNPKWALLY